MRIKYYLSNQIFLVYQESDPPQNTRFMNNDTYLQNHIKESNN